jgi:integrase
MKGHIRPRGKKTWAIVVDIGADPVTGKRRQRWETVHGSKRKAQQALNHKLDELAIGTYVDPSKMTVDEYLKRWLADYAKPKVSAKTYERYDEIVRCHLTPGLGEHSMADLRPLHIQGYYSRALDSGRLRHGKGGLSKRTVLHHHRILREALEQAVKWQILPRNPADAVEAPRPNRIEMRSLNDAQIKTFLAASEGNKLLRMAILLALTTGLRRGEILALRWRDLDLDSSVLAVRQSLEETKKELTFKEPKTAKSRRTVALPAMTVEALRKHRADQARIRLQLGPAYQDSDLVCAQPNGRPLHPRSLTHAFIGLVAREKLPKVRFHDLRHSHATLLLQQGVHPKVVSERLGHSTVGITLDVYSHVLPGMQEEAAKKVDAALRGA